MIKRQGWWKEKFIQNASIQGWWTAVSNTFFSVTRMARFYRHFKKKRKEKGELGGSWVLTLGKFLLGSVLLPDSSLLLGRGGVVLSDGKQQGSCRLVFGAQVFKGWVSFFQVSVLVINLINTFTRYACNLGKNRAIESGRRGRQQKLNQIVKSWKIYHHPYKWTEKLDLARICRKHSYSKLKEQFDCLCSVHSTVT